ncbi:hypothetical protein PMIN07_008719 [Paraphaeosphaeria minitans]
MAAPAQGVPTGPTPPIVACLRCREQKLKCGRELPTCERCRKKDAACTYPPPPDRKRIAAEKNRSKASQANNSSHTHEHGSSFSKTHATKKRRLSYSNTVPFDCLAEPDVADLPSTEIGLLLQEVYFKHIYHAHLMFHKTVTFQVYMLKKMPDHLQRAIFAHGALFLQEVDPQYQKYVKAYPMQTLYERSWSWAHAASVQVLSHVDEPSVPKIQTLLVLQQFYWARGEIVRAKIHATLAYRLSQLLGYDELYENGDPALVNPSLKFDREIRRRSYWASWGTMCLHSEEIVQRYNRARGLPLPAEFGPGGSIQGVELIHGQKMTRTWKVDSDSELNNGETSTLTAEMMKLLGIWGNTRALVLTFKNRPTLEGIEEFDQVDESLDEIEPSVQFLVQDIFAKAKSYDESPEFLVCVCSVFYLSRAFVDVFKAVNLDPDTRTLGATPASQLSTGKRAIEESLRFIQLLQQLLETGQDITRLWHVAGYAAFIAAQILAHADRDIYSEGLKTCRTIIEVLSTYWKPLKSLAANLKATMEAARYPNVVLPLFYLLDYVNFFCDGELASDVGN